MGQHCDRCRQKGYVSADYLTVKTGEKPDNTTSNTASAKGAAVVVYGKQFIGTPYVWGGTNLNTGVDCSGFVYAVYKNFGITLSRSSASMTSNGVEVSKANLQAGDLVFLIQVETAVSAMSAFIAVTVHTFIQRMERATVLP